MLLETYLSEIEKLKTELDGFYPIPNNLLNTINYKLRLDWNYHSNKMTIKGAKGENLFESDLDANTLKTTLEIAHKMKIEGESFEKISLFTGISFDDFLKL